MTGKKKAIIISCVGAGIILIGILIYFFFIRFSIVGKWKIQESQNSKYLHINSFEFNSNGDVYVYSDKNTMFKGHYTLKDDNQTITIHFDESSGYSSSNRMLQFEIVNKTHNSMVLIKERVENGVNYGGSKFDEVEFKKV